MSYSITPISLELWAFRCFEYIKYDFPPAGLFLVEGDNAVWSAADSNGAGKTTIAHGLCWTCFGKTMDGESGSDIVNNLIQKNTRGRFKFKVGNDIYVITRYEAHEKYKNKLFFKAGGASLLGSTKDETQEKINGVLGMDLKTFTTAVMVEEFPFTGSSDADQKKVLDRILGLEGLERARKYTADQIASKRKELERIEEKIRNTEDKWQACRDYIADLQDKDAGYASSRSSRVKDLKRELKDEQRKLEDLKAIDYGAKRTPVRQQIKEIESLLEEEPAFRKKLSNAQEKRGDLRSKIAVLQREIRDIDDRCTQLKDLEGTCDKCEQKVPHEHIESRLKEHQKQRKAKEAEFEELDAQRDAVEARIKKIADLLDSLEDDRRRLQRLKTKDQDLLDQAKEVGHKIDMVKRNIGGLAEQIDDAGNDPSPYKDLIREQALKKKDLLHRLVGLRSDLSFVEQEIKDLSFAEEALGNAGIRSYVFDDVAVVLNQHIKYASRKLTDGKIKIKFVTQSKTKKGELREKFHVEIVNSLGGHTYKVNSKGERKRIDACVMLALNLLTRSRSNRQLGILWLDEFLDGLDRTGRIRMIEVLREIAKDCWVAVVTHAQDMRSLFLSKNVIKVRKDGDYSVLV